MARSYNRLRDTTFDLYVERDALSAYFRFLILLSTWIVCVGYILFALAFSLADEDLAESISRTLLVALASALLIVGYVSSAITAFFSKSLLFLIDSALYPLFTASLMGVAITALTYGIHKNHLDQPVYMVVPLVTSCLTTVVTGVLLALVYKEVNRIKDRDERRRWHVAMGPYSGDPSQSTYSQQGLVSGTEDDAQRRQLMRLLQERHEQTSMDQMRGTYKIDLPGEQRDNLLAWNPGTPPASRSRFNISDLLPWNAASSGTFKDARERRREQIERSGLPSSADSPGGTKQQRSRSRSRKPRNEEPRHPALEEPQNQSTWGRPVATRYA